MVESLAQMLNWQVYDNADYGLTENPIWDKKRNGLWWIDIPQQTVHFKSPNYTTQNYYLNEQPGCLWLNGDCVFIAGRSAIWQLDIKLKQFSKILNAPFDSNNQRFNDCAQRQKNNIQTIVIGSLIDNKQSPQASLFHYYQGKLKILQSGFTTINGIGFLSYTQLIVADTFSRLIQQFTWDNQLLEISNHKTLWYQPESLARPDGLWTYQQKLYFCMFEGQHIMQLNLDLSINCLQVPVFCPTKITCGGINDELIFMTSAGNLRTQQEQLNYPQSGKILYCAKEDFLSQFI